jgi:tRNA pseudouridine synthase 10
MPAAEIDPPPAPAPRVKRCVFLESRYQKLVRGLPQTIFWCPSCKGDRRGRKTCALCGGRGKLHDDSVQELIGRSLLPAFRARFGKFHGAGREDVDVRMLGRGRPFVFELVDPRRLDPDLDELRELVLERAAGRMSIAPFVRVDKDRVTVLKAAAWPKVYRAEIGIGGPVDPARAAELVGRRLSIVQRTPQRVAHRRGDLERAREVSVLRLEPRGELAMELEVRCQHGTYVKEWISGDEGRTVPSLSELLGTPAVCHALDVLEIEDQ